MTATISQEQARAVLAAYRVSPVAVRALTDGLINETWYARAADGAEYALQAVNDMFPPHINLDIDAVTRHLEQEGLAPPRLLKNRAGMVYHQEEGRTWRLFTYIAGRVYQRLDEPDPAAAAGDMLGRLHTALGRFTGELQVDRPLPHDTARHARRLASVLESCRDHPRYAQIAPLGETLRRRLAQLPKLPPLPLRLVHGDPKISNFIFTEDGGQVRCMVDFDTLGKAPVCLELGDALRSWCNPQGEDTTAGYFSMAHCRAALGGYAARTGAWMTRREANAVAPATVLICTELAARFCIDALAEDFFSWDADRFNSHSEHSEIRARGQLRLADSVMDQYETLAAAVRQAFAGGD